MVFPFYFGDIMVKFVMIMNGGMTLQKTEKTSVTRHAQRVLSVELLYSLDLNSTATFEPSEHTFVNEVVSGILKYQDTIDEIINSQLERWSLKRLSYVDRAILRLATYEMYAMQTPGEIVINEALELTRTFTDEGDNKAVKFNNSVLDKIKKSLNK